MTNEMNGRTPSRNGRLSSQSGSRKLKGDTLFDVTTSIVNSNGKSLESSGRFNTMKKAAEEQRKRVRENREKLLEEEKAVNQARRNEEIRMQIRASLDGMIDDMRKDIFSQLESRLSEERNNLKKNLVNELLEDEGSLAKEIEKRTSNGETFEARLSRLKVEFENNFNKILKSEYKQVQNDVTSTLDQKLESEKLKWQHSFKLEGMKRLKVTEDAVRTDFRVGLEDSQRQCSEILSSVEEKSASLEQKITNKIVGMDAEFVASIQESEQKTCLLIIDKLNERDKVLKELFNEETEKVQNDVKRVRKDVSRIKSKICVIL